MVGACRGICGDYRVVGRCDEPRYSAGQKRCQICGIFIEWVGLWCPCCGYRLRTKPRSAKTKKMYRTAMERPQKVLVYAKIR